jgi:H-type lectin domain
VFDFPQTPNNMVKVYASDITANGFTINIDSAPGLTPYGGGAKWLA